MEGLFLLLVATLLFIHGWYLLGLFVDARTMGVFSGAIAVALLLITMADGISTPILIAPDAISLITAVKGLVLLWVVYAAALAAHGLWGFEERVLGFHALLIWVVSLVLVALPWRFSEAQISTPAAILMSVAFFVIAIDAAMIFFHQTFRFRHIRGVTGWFLLIGSGLMGVMAMAVYFPPLT